MATNILLKSSVVASKIPTTAQLSLRELAVNTADGKLFLRQGTGIAGDNIYTVNPWNQSTGGASYNLSFTAGNVGIGTTPSYKLDVFGSGSFRPASTQDGLIVSGRAGGTSSYSVTITPTTLNANRTLTVPDITGTIITTGDTGTVTNTMLSGSIANAKLANSTISGVALGSNLNTLTLNVSGTGLSGSTTYNGSTAATFTVTSNATNTNTASTIVARDGSGNFSAGTITAALSGNASTATTATNLSGGSVSATTGSFSGQITSTLASGTAPLSITSTTTVPNLSAERISDITGTGSALRITHPRGASYATNTASVTGAIKIKLPTATFKSNTMMRMTIKIYEYAGGASGTSRTIEVGGYNYSDAAANWYNYFAYQNTMGGSDINVRFGNDGTSQCIWIGETSTSWAYPQVFVTDFQAGYSSYTDALWGSGWAVSFATAFDTVTQGPIVAGKNLNSQNYNSYAPTLTGTGASGTWGISVTGNAGTATQVSNSLTFNNSGTGAASGTTFNGSAAQTISYNTLGASPLAGSSSLTTTGTVTSGTWSASFGAVSGANLTNLTAGNLSGTIPSAVLGNSSLNIGTTSIALNRASANLALTGISSIALPGATSGTITLQPAATAGTTTITLPATTGTVVTTGDTGSVTSTMIAAGTIVNADINASAAIAVSKLAASTISGVTLGNNLNALTIGTGLSGTSYNGSAAVTIAIDSTVATLSGTQTLTNKTFTDSSTTFQDGVDTTKKMQFQLSSITTATTRTLTVPDVNGTIVTTGDTGTVTNTMLAGSIANTKLANSTISGVALGSNLNTLTLNVSGTGLSGSTTYNGSAAATFTVTSNATNANTASTIVARDASGNFSAGTITATTFSGSGASLTNLPAGQLSGTIPSAVLGNSSVNIGTTSIALNRASANLALTGISSIALPGATSGTVTLQPAATAGTTTITLPATTGTVVTTGDSGTVTGTMIANTTIAVGKLSATGTANSTTFLRGDNTWSTISTGITVSDDTTTNATRYLVFEDVTSGSSSTVNVSSTKLTFNPSTGNLVVGGTITANSDISLKKNIKTIPNALDKVLSLRGVEFKFKKNNEKSIGVIAQEVEKVVPELVKEGENGVKSVAYQNIVGLLIESIKDLQGQIADMKNEISALKEKN